MININIQNWKKPIKALKSFIINSFLQWAFIFILKFLSLKFLDNFLVPDSVYLNWAF